MSKHPASPSKPHVHPSPNYGERRDGRQPELIVIHYTAMESAEAALDRLCSAEHEVSAHYLIRCDGDVVQLVDEDKRAWHAGAGMWRGQGDVNSRSIGIELDNTGFHPFPAPQMDALVLLISHIRQRWNIPPEGVIGHSDFAPDRKGDPGQRFDWRRLALEGQSIWPHPAAESVEASETAFLAAAADVGYPVDVGFRHVLAALRLRFRPWANGPLDATDMAIAQDLATRFGVDRSPASP